jgi:uncharacterized membrane protein YidH (DUF202 family)
MADDISDQHWIETYKSLITLSIEGFKFALFANGGAAVALLAYLGNVSGKGSSVPDMHCAMAKFLVGIVACGLAMVFAYLTQLQLLNESRRGAVPPRLSHAWPLWAAIILFVVSIVLFGVGSWQSVTHFR